MSRRYTLHTTAGEGNQAAALEGLIQELIASPNSPFDESDEPVLKKMTGVAIRDLIKKYVAADVAEEDELPEPVANRRHTRVYLHDSGYQPHGHSRSPQRMLADRMLASLHTNAGRANDPVLKARQRADYWQDYYDNGGFTRGRGVKVNANDPVLDALPPSSHPAVRKNHWR